MILTHTDLLPLSSSLLSLDCCAESTLFCLVLAVGPNRTKLVTPNSSLKFTPEELVLYCRDLRVICFLFDRLTPDTQVIEVQLILVFLLSVFPFFVNLTYVSAIIQIPLLEVV